VPHPARRRRRRRHPSGPSPLRRARLAATALALVVPLGACTATEDGEGSSGPRGQRAGSDGGERTGQVRTTVVRGARVGRLSPKQHRQVATRVAGVVDGWWDAAFVEADYPRRRYQGSFPGFTRAASAQAWRQRDLMTSARLGDRIDDLVPLRRRVAVDVLATGGRARAVTARARMDYRTTGEVEKRIRVEGRLLLTFDRGWKVFGFDVTQGPWQTKGQTKGQTKQQAKRKRGGR